MINYYFIIIENIDSGLGMANFNKIDSGLGMTNSNKIDSALAWRFLTKPIRPGHGDSRRSRV